MLVRILGVQPRGLESLRGLLYRPDQRWIMINHHPYRLVPGTAPDGLVLWIPKAADYSGRFSLSQPARTLTVWRDTVTHGSAKDITYRFEQMPIQSLRPARARPTR
jgi:hypothetical protein